jgi:(1->4)-alpha-D-glucan 1-alpha-D-glucosylmutase
VHFPVYRTYAGEDGRNALDQQAFDRSADRARQTLCSADCPLLQVTGRWLGGDAPNRFEGSDTKDLRLRAITRFQQLTLPLAAKPVEDTAFYRYGRLVSRNEVGADPARFSISVQDFHVATVARAALSEYLACDCHARSQARRRCSGPHCSTERNAPAVERAVRR